MKVLIFIPHDTLLSPQGHRERLLALTRALRRDEIVLLVPETTPVQDTQGLGGAKVRYFSEPGLWGRSIPYLLDFTSSWVKALVATAKAEQVDLVIFDFPWGLTRAAACLPQPTVYFSHGLEAEFAVVALKHLRLALWPLTALARSVCRTLERRACDAAKLIVTMSNRDAALYQEAYGIVPTKLVSFSQPARIAVVTSVDRSSQRARYGIASTDIVAVFHGSWRHYPNREAINNICYKIAPYCLERDRRLKFIVAGTNIPEFRSANVMTVGFVEELLSFLSACDLGILPITSGAGVRMKAFDYFSAGLPVLSTEKGVEGIDVLKDQEIAISSPIMKQFSEILLELAADEARRKILVQNATLFLQEFHDPTVTTSLLRGRLGELVPSTEETKAISRR